MIDAGLGNDTVSFYGTETSIDGNAGTDTLVLAAAGGITAVNLPRAPTRRPATPSTSPASKASMPAS